MQSETNKRRLSPPAITAIALLVIAGISLYIRLALPYDQVFVNGSVWFKGVDAWYHMRLIDNLVHNFPLHISFDPYTFYPHGTAVPWPPFFDWLVAGTAWLAGLGSPSQHTIDAVGAYLPPILGTLTIVPVYFIGKALFNRWVGVLSAALIAILPGEFLNRSLLGFTDHHVAESLFTTSTILFLILAVKKARERELSFTHLLNRNWTTITTPLIYTLLAGIFLGIYLLTWVGGLLLLFIIFAWLVIQFLIDHLRRNRTDYLCIIGTLSSLVAFIIFLPFLGQSQLSGLSRASLIIAMVMPLLLSGISRFMVRKSVKPAYYPLALLSLAGIGFAVFYLIDPSLFHSMLHKFRIFTPSGAALTILEVHPLLFPSGQFSLQIVWVNFTTSFFIFFISFGWLIYRNIKEESADKTLLLVWSLIMLMAVLGQRRFSYYFAINAALLAGYFSWRILDFAGLRELLDKPKQMAKAYTETRKEKKKKSRAKARASGKTFLQPRATWIKVIVAGIVIFFLVFFPNINKAATIGSEPGLMNQSWYSSLEWLKDNSPEPFGDPDFYYQHYETPFQYPETAYSIMSWWDYGHWITRIAHRMPISNPFQQGPSQAASFLIAQDEDSANQKMDKLGSKYVIIDYDMLQWPVYTTEGEFVRLTGKFYAFPTWVDSSLDDFFEVYHRQDQSGKLEPIVLFYPAFYRSMVVRLYNFNGRAVTPKDSTTVISYEEKMNQDGVLYKKITGSKLFPTYEAAGDYISSQESGNWRIIGANPLTSAVPLEEMEHYKLVHTSTQKRQGNAIVKIFEYVK